MCQLTIDIDLAAALVAHVFTLPLWLILAVGVGESLPAPPQSVFWLAEWVFLALPFCLWGLLAMRLVVWWKQGRRPVWPYPLRWAVALFGTFFTLIALFSPRVRQWLRPPLPSR